MTAFFRLLVILMILVFAASACSSDASEKTGSDAPIHAPNNQSGDSGIRPEQERCGQVTSRGECRGNTALWCDFDLHLNTQSCEDTGGTGCQDGACRGIPLGSPCDRSRNLCDRNLICQNGTCTTPELGNLAIQVQGERRVRNASETIDCPARSCNIRLAGGEEVSLTAEPDAEWKFSRWSGDCSGYNRTTSVTIQSNTLRNCLAVFERIHPTLEIIVPDGGGTVRLDQLDLRCTDHCEFTVDYRQELTLTAIPGPGYTFVTWQQCDESQDASITIVPTHDHVCVAKFLRLEDLVIEVVGPGRVISDSEVAPDIDCADTCTFTLPANSRVDVRAIPDPDGRFVQWEGDCAGYGTTRSLHLSPPGPYRCRAIFERVPLYPLTITVEGPGTITGTPADIHCTSGSTCTQNHQAATQFRLTPHPEPDALFMGWKQLQPSSPDGSSNCRAGISGIAEPFMDQAYHCLAQFQPIRNATQIWQHTAPPPDMTRVQWKPDGTQIAASNSSTLRFFDTGNGNFIGQFSLSNIAQSANPFAWNPQGTSIALTFERPPYSNTPAAYGIRIYDAVPNSQNVSISTPHKITSLTWDPTGTMIALGAENGSIQIVVPTTRAVIKTWSAYNTAATELSWSPNGQYLITSSLSENTRIWSTTAWIVEHEFTGTPWRSLVWNHNATKFAGIADGQIHLATLNTTPDNMQLTSLPATGCESISFNPAGTKLVATCDDQWMIWDIATQSRLFTAPFLATTTVQSAQWNPVHDTILVQYADDSLRIFHGNDYQLLLVLKGAHDAINTLIHNPATNVLYASSRDGLLYGLDGSTGAVQSNFHIPGQPQSINSLVFSRVNNSLLSSLDGYVYEWSTQTGASLPPWHTGTRATQTPTQLTLSDDDLLATALGWTDGIRLWPTRGQPHSQTLTSLQNFPSIAWQPGGKLLASSAARTTHLWNTETGIIERTLECPPMQNASNVAFSSDGQLIAIPCSNSFSSPTNIGIWNVTTGDLLYTLARAPNPPRMAWRPGTEFIAIGKTSDNKIIIINATTGQSFLAPDLQIPFMTPTSMTWSADGKNLFVGQSTGIITAYDIPF